LKKIHEKGNKSDNRCGICIHCHNLKLIDNQMNVKLEFGYWGLESGCDGWALEALFNLIRAKPIAAEG
jgi:hypothetical protein